MTYFVKLYKHDPYPFIANEKPPNTECDNLDKARITAVKYYRMGEYYWICTVPWLGHRERGVGISKTKYGAIVGFVTPIDHVWYWVPNKANAEIKRINPDTGKIMR